MSTPKRPILIGKAEEIDLVRPDVRRMLDNPGFYIGGDSRHPNVLIALWSQDGKVKAMSLDNELAPERFLETVTLRGPFLPNPPKPEPVTRDTVKQWAAANLTLVDARIDVYEAHWFNEREHLLTKLRVMLHDNGGWIIILSCSASYGGDETQWKGVNIGNVKSIAQLDHILDGMKETAT